MPQYNGPAAITSLVGADMLLVWQTSAAANKTITFANLVTSVESLLSKVDDVAIIASNTTLDSSYEFVVCNSGGAFNVTLPLSADNPGRAYKIANKGAGLVTVQRTGGDVIAAGGSAGASTTIAQYNSYIFEADGVDTWHRTS